MWESTRARTLPRCRSAIAHRTSSQWILRLTAVGISGEVVGTHDWNIDPRTGLTTRGATGHADSAPREILLAPLGWHGACRPDACRGSGQPGTPGRGRSRGK